MIQLLEGRQIGANPDWLLPKVFANHKWTEIELAGGTEFVRSHTKGITSLALEHTTNR